RLTGANAHRLLGCESELRVRSCGFHRFVRVSGARQRIRRSSTSVETSRPHVRAVRRAPFLYYTGHPMTPEQFRAEGHRLIDWIADHRASIADRRVMAATLPGDVRAALPATPPQTAEPFD